MGTNDWSLNVVGESYRNPDGSSRQTEIARCRAGEAVILTREPDNRHDTNAVAVHSARGVQIGYVAAEHARWIGGKIDDGHRVLALIERIHGGTKGKPSRGVLIRLNLEGEQPAKPSFMRRLFGS